jgi:UDP-glucose 4-epimerase
MVRRLLENGARRIVVYSRDEKKQWDMREQYLDDSRLEMVIGDVRDYDRLRAAMRNIDYVFSAAALKQVPSCEECPIEAVKTNVLGTENVCQAAIASGVQAVCVLTTDKAVEPINAMGMTKALAEKVMASHAVGTRNGSHLTRFFGVRYGNVLGSRGSVLETWAKSPTIRVTDSKMTRFVMMMRDAIDLVLFALDAPADLSGSVFVHAAKACTVFDLAHALEAIRGTDKDIEIIGHRPGEKTHETLIAAHELYRTEILDGIFCIHPHRPTREIRTRETIFSSDTCYRESNDSLVAKVHEALREMA